MDTTTEFHNKRDNPLFWADGSSHFEEDNDGLVKFSKFEISKSSGSNNFKGSNVGCGETRRGRSVSRSVGVNGGERTDFGRSLSRINPTRRRRSPSCGHYKNSEVFGFLFLIYLLLLVLGFKVFLSILCWELLNFLCISVKLVL